MICIYDSRDLDGITSAAIVKKKYPLCTLVPYRYGADIDYTGLQQDTVIVVDIGLPTKVILELSRNCSSLRIYDHHISAYKELMQADIRLPVNLDYVYTSECSACKLVWTKLYPECDVPLMVQCLSDFDSFNHFGSCDWYNTTMPIQYYARSVAFVPSEIPEHWLDPDIIFDAGEYIKLGTFVLDYVKKSLNFLASTNSYETTLCNGDEHYNIIAMNITGGYGTLAFDSVYDKNKHHMMCAYYFNGENWVVSFYTYREDVDCSKLIKLLSSNGGGHRKAAGCTLDSIENSTIFRKL